MPRKSVPIILADGKERHLRYDFNALCTLEEEKNIPIQELITIVSGSVSLRTLRGILWAGLLHEGEGLSEKQVGELIEMDKLADIATSLAEALNASFGPAIEPKNAETPKPE